MLNEVRSILALGGDRDWRPAIVLTEATRGEGVPELWEKIEAHRAHLVESGRLEERRARHPAGGGVFLAAGGAEGRPQPAGAPGPRRPRAVDPGRRGGGPAPPDRPG